MNTDPLHGLTTYSLDKAASPADEEKIAAFEAELGAPLPKEYRRFLLQSGPVGIEGAARIPVECGEDTSVSVLYGLGCKPSWDLRHQTMEVYPGRIPDDTVPVGEDAGTGDLALLSIEGERAGEVYVWWHDHPEIDSARLAKMQWDLKEEGYNLASMDIGAMIHAWENAHADELGYKPLWGNVRRIAASFEDLLRLLAGQKA